MSITIDTPEGIEAFRLLSMWSAMRLEALGMRVTNRSVTQMCKKEFGLKGSREKVIAEFEAILVEAGILNKETLA